MNLKLWNLLTENQKLTLFRRNKLALLETKPFDLNKYYPNISLSKKLTQGELIKCK